MLIKVLGHHGAGNTSITGIRGTPFERYLLHEDGTQLVPPNPGTPLFWQAPAPCEIHFFSYAVTIPAVAADRSPNFGFYSLPNTGTFPQVQGDGFQFTIKNSSGTVIQDFTLVPDIHQSYYGLGIQKFIFQKYDISPLDDAEAIADVGFDFKEYCGAPLYMRAGDRFNLDFTGDIGSTARTFRFKVSGHYV